MFGRVLILSLTTSLALAATGADAGAQGTATAGAAPAVVILVRHAEKAATPADDPSLTPEGAERARALELALASTGVTAIITTEFKRTRETAAPLAAKRGITPEVVPASGASSADHVQAVVRAVRRQSGVVLVVGHSNTVPAIIAALGSEQMRALCESDYDNLFIVARVGAENKLVKSRYGAADKSDLGASPCPVMSIPPG